MFMTILAALTSMIVIISATGFGQIMNEEVQIAARTFTRIENLSVRPRIVSPDLAKLEVSFDVTDRIKVDEDIRIEAEVRELVAGTERVLGRSERTEPVAASFANTVRSQRLGRKGAGNVSSVCFEIEMVNPKLWWPSGLGDQAMYRIDLMAYFANEGVLEAAGSAKATDTFGIMELGLLDPCGDPVGRPPVIGYKVPFLINRSSPLFVKGTIWARPEDTGSGGDELVKKLIEKAAGVGINAFWIKSDVSESDDFYSLCDKSGILVLRELPSADARGIDLEGKDYLQQCAVLLKRLKDHPCVALWTVSGASSAEIAELEKLCAEIVPGSLLLPGMSAQGDTILWRTSSKRGGCDRCEFGSSQGLNITHWSAVVLENQQGFVSTPVIENLKENLPQASLEREARDNAAETAPSIGSESADEMAETAHTSFSFEQKEPTLPSQLPRVKMSDSATDLLLQMGLQSSSLSSGRELDSKAARELDESASRYELSRRGVNGLLRSPDYLDKYVAVTQLEQAATTQRIVESWRRRGFEGGALFLGQLAETRPGITRSVIDWRGTPKPSYYFLKRAMRDLHICADFRLKDSEPLTVTKSKRFNVDIYVLNNTSETRKNVIASAKVFASNMLMVSSLAKKLDAPSLNSTYAFTLDSTVSEDLEDSMLFMWLGLTDRNGDFLSSNFYSLGALPAAKAFPDVDVLLISDRRYEIESSLTFLDDSGMDLTYVASSDDLTKAAPAYTDYTDDFTEYGDGAEEAGAGQNMDAMDPYARRGYAGPGDPYMYPTNDKGSYDRFGQDTTEQTTNTTQTATPPPNLEDVYDVIIIDAAACEKLDDDKITSIKNAVEKGCGLLICGVGKKLAGTGIESISPVEFVTKGAPDTPNVVTLEIPDHPVLADLPSDRYLQSLGATDIVALNGTDQNALDGNGSILISAGHSTPILAESSYGEGRILAFVPGLDKDAPDALKGMWASMIAYLSKLSYPDMRRAREIQSARPYAGLNMLPKAELEAIVVDDGKEIAAPRPKSQFVVDVYNRSQWLAFQIGLKVRAKSVGATRSTENQAAGAREAQIEADLSDDYFSLIPSEKRRIKITLPDDVIENVGPLKCVVSGWNTNTLELPLPISAKRLASRTETGPPAEAVAESAEVKKETLDLDANTEQSEAGIVENKLERAREAQLQKDHLPLLGMFELARDYLTSGVASRLSNVLRIKPLGATRPPQVNEDQTGVSVGRYDILELSFELNPPDGRHYANPFQDVEVSAAFTSPSGRRGLNRPVDKSGGVVKDIPVEGFYDGGRVWRVRFAPDEIGKWTYTIVAKVSPRAKRRGESDEAVVSGDFECVESSLHGFIEVDPEHPRRLCYHDRTPFLVAGGGAFSPWQTHVTGVLNWEDYLESHSRNGLNAVRLYLYQENHRGPRRKIVICVMEEGSTDRYDLAHAQRLDRFMNRARELGVTAIFVFFDHWPMVHDWDKSVLNVANGGPCVKAAELFTNRKAIQIQKKMIRYLVARWGAYDNMLAWEFWNECDIVPGADIGKNKAVMIWHREIAKFLADIDPYSHIQFTSFCSGVTAPDWYIEPWNEIVSYHHYAAYDGGDEKTVDDDFDLKLNEFRKVEKPIIIAELGYKKYAGDASEAKKNYLRIATWSAVFQGYGFILWDDTDFRIIPGTRKYISYLTKFVEQNHLLVMSPLSTAIESLNNDGLRIWLMADRNGEDRYAAYIHSFNDHNAPVRDASLALNVRRSGKYRLQWYDPKLDAYCDETDIQVKGGLAILQAPEFKMDIAFVIERRAVGGLASAQDK